MRHSTQLRIAQRKAIRKLIEQPRQAVFADMGAGKTAITLYALRAMDKPCTLIISTLRVVSLVWMQEALEWKDLDFKFSLVTGTAKQRAEALQVSADIYLINIDNIQWLMRQTQLPPFEVLVLDELSLWKGRGKRWQSLRAFARGMDRVIGLTGTPATNGLIDLWPQIELIQPGCLHRTLTQYRQHWFYQGFDGFRWLPRPDAEQDILKAIESHVIRIGNEEMPELVYNRMQVPLPESAVRRIRELAVERLIEIDGHTITAESNAVLYGKRQQMSNGCVYTEEGATVHVHSAKLDALEEIRQELQGAPMLVAYWYNHDLTALRMWDLNAPVLGSNTSAQRAGELIDQWNQGKIPVLFIHPASAGHGLNLQDGGHHIIWYSLTWDLDKFDQTNARLARPGQQADTVFSHLLIGDEIDRVIADALVAKADVQQAVLDYFAEQ